MTATTDLPRFDLVIALTALLAACGGVPTAPTSTGPSQPAVTTPTAPTGRLIWDTSGPARGGEPGGAGAVTRELVTSVPRGPLTLFLEWTPAESDVRIQVTNLDCPGGLINGVFFNDLCPIYAEANQRAVGAQRIDFENAATRGMAFWISNYSTSAVNYRLRVFAPGSTPAPTPTPTPASGGPIGQVALLGSSIPFGQAIPTVRLGTAGQAAPSLTFSIAVRTFASQTRLLARVYVRTETVRCMGAGISFLDFAAGEQRVLNLPNVSFQSGNDPAPCTLPYTTMSVEITLTSAAGQEVLSQAFPGSYTFLPPT